MIQGRERAIIRMGITNRFSTREEANHSLTSEGTIYLEKY